MTIVGVDVGGTFTDLVLFDESRRAFVTAKVPSTPDDPSLAILEGTRACLRQGGISPDDVSAFLHGTTITTNALIQLRGARSALLVNRGMKGIAQVQSHMKVGPRHAMDRQRVPALVDELDIFEVTGRLDCDGNEIIALDEAEIRGIGRAIAERELESVAIALLFSFANPAHERRIAQLIQSEAPACQISCSSEIMPRIREWPRMSTAILNAYLEPVLVEYLAHLATGLVEAGIDTPKTYLMQSNGGVMPFSAVTAGGKAIHTLLSGPAATVQAARRIAEVTDTRDLVTMDIGGTSCDIAFVRGTTAMEVTAGDVCGYDLYVPMLDISTIGAGGGTIARVDAGGALRVGPRSAGAIPGPAAYGRGGTSATVTDADVILGYLNPSYFLGGALKLEEDRAREAVRANVAEPLGLGLEEAALAIVRINDAHMADAIRVSASKRDVNIAASSIVASGGAGPVHACGVAEELGIRKVIVPEYPGVFSALGLLCTDVAQDYVQTSILRLDRANAATIERGFAELEERARADYQAQGYSGEELRIARELDARYAGQGFEIRVPVHEPADPAVCETATALFHKIHRDTYGHSAETEAVEIVSFRIRAVVPMRQYHPARSGAQGTAGQDGEDATTAAPPGTAPSRTRTLWFASGPTTATVLRRADLQPGDLVAGPAVIEQADTTTVLPAGWTGAIDEFGSLTLTR